MTAEEIKASGNAISMRTLSMMGKKIRFDNSRGVADLKMTYHPLSRTIIDMAYSLIKNGLVENKLNDS